jgi:hypothetical protein
MSESDFLRTKYQAERVLRARLWVWPVELARAVPGLTWLEARSFLEIFVKENIAVRHRDGRFYYVRPEFR